VTAGDTECRVHRLVADVAIIADGRVLLVKYRDTSRYDHQPGWFLPDDYLQHREDPGGAARRIAQEQVGIALPSSRLGHVESFGNGFWHLVFHYQADLGSTQPPASSENVLAAQWFPLHALPPPEEWGHEGWGLDTLAVMGFRGERP